MRTNIIVRCSLIIFSITSTVFADDFQIQNDFQSIFKIPPEFIKKQLAEQAAREKAIQHADDEHRKKYPHLIPTGYCKKKDGKKGKECLHSYECQSKYCSGDLHTDCVTNQHCINSKVCGKKDKKCCMQLDYACSDSSDCCQQESPVYCMPYFMLKGTTYERSNTYCKISTKLIGESCSKDGECLDRADSGSHCKNGKCCLGNKASCEKNEECCNGKCTSLGGIKFNQRECCAANKVGISEKCTNDGDCCTGNCNNGKCHLSGCTKDGHECYPMIDDKLSPNQIRKALKEYEAERRSGSGYVQKGNKIKKLEYSTFFSLHSVCCEGSRCDSTQPMIPGHYAGKPGKCVPIVYE